MSLVLEEQIVIFVVIFIQYDMPDKAIHTGITKHDTTWKVFGIEQTYVYEILVTGPIGTSECAGECRFSCKLVQICSRCHCRCHSRSHTQCRYFNYKCKCPLNVFVDANVSGRITNEHLKTFFLSVLNPYLSTNTLVLCGSWSGHKDEQVLLEAFGGKDVDLKIIPPKTTKYTQPLDVYFFRQCKIYAKKLTVFIKLRSSNMEPKLHGRFFIMKFLSVIYNQLSAEAYRPMFRYA